jgi:hypothetical protein
MKTLIAALLIAASLPVDAYALLTWTGRAKTVTTISGLPAWSCEYRLPSGGTTWVLFRYETYCLASVEAE